MVDTAQSQPASPAPWAEAFESLLTRQVLEAHLLQRRQALEGDPSRLEEAPPEQAGLLVKAMAAAAHADGAVDALEAARIERALRTVAVIDGGLGKDLAWVLETPPCLEQLVREVRDEATAVRFYAVSVRALRRGVTTNRAYLDYLAHRLRVPTDLVLRINRRFDVPLYVR